MKKSQNKKQNTLNCHLNRSVSMARQNNNDEYIKINFAKAKRETCQVFRTSFIETKNPIIRQDFCFG